MQYKKSSFHTSVFSVGLTIAIVTGTFPGTVSKAKS